MKTRASCLGIFVCLVITISFFASVVFFAVPAVHASESIKFVQGPSNPPIVPSDNISYSLMANGTYQAYFKNNSITSKAVRFQNKGYTFDMDISTSQLHWYNSTYNAIIGMVREMNPQNTQVTSSGNAITYFGAWIDTDLQYQAYSDELKETLIIHNVSAPSSSIKPDFLQYGANCYFNNSLTIYADGVGYLHPTNQRFTTNGVLDFNDASNQTVFWLPQPSLYDSNGSLAMGTYAVTVNNGIIIINIRIPRVFLDAAVFPVYFDPPVRVQGNARGTATSGSTITVTMGSTPISGNVLVAVIGTCRQYGYWTVSSIAETGVTWTVQKTSAKTTAVTYVNSEIWFGVVSAGANATITITMNAASYDRAGVANICEYSGVLTAVFLDKTASTTGTGTPLATGTTDVTTQDAELWIGGAAQGSLGLLTTAQSSPTNNFTLLDGAVYNAYVSCGYLEKIVSTTGNASSGATCAPTWGWAGCIATFKAATAAGQNLVFTPFENVNVASYSQMLKELAFQTTNTFVPSSTGYFWKALGFQTANAIIPSSTAMFLKALEFQNTAIINPFGSSSMYKALGFSSSEIVNFFSSLSKNAELAFQWSDAIMLWDSNVILKSLNYPISENTGLFDSSAMNKAVGSVVYEYLQGGLLHLLDKVYFNKEIAFINEGLINVWSAATSSFSKVAILFEEVGNVLIKGSTYFGAEVLPSYLAFLVVGGILGGTGTLAIYILKRKRD